MALSLIVAFACAVIISGCAAEKIQTYSLGGWSIIYNDYDKTRLLCNNHRAVGCTDFTNKVVYCPFNRPDICGHEVRHITHGFWHK